MTVAANVRTASLPSLRRTLCFALKSVTYIHSLNGEKQQFLWSRRTHRSSASSFAITTAFRIQQLPSDEYEGKEGSA